MKVKITENQLRKIIISEESLGDINKNSVTLNDIWYGFEKLKHGDYQTKESSPLKKVQTKLKNKFPKYAKEIGFRADNDFGDRTSKMIGKLFDIKFNDLSSVEIGPKTLEKLGFEKPKELSLNEKMIAMTLAMEKWGDDEEEIKAISNVIANRSSAGRGTVVDIILEPSQFSGWDDYQPIKKNDEYINQILRDKRYMNRPSWDTAVKYAKLLLSGAKFNDNTNGATHYYNPKKVSPNWGRGSKYWKEHTTEGLEHVYGKDTKANWSKNFKGR